MKKDSNGPALSTGGKSLHSNGSAGPRQYYKVSGKEASPNVAGASGKTTPKPY